MKEKVPVILAPIRHKAQHVNTVAAFYILP